MTEVTSHSHVHYKEIGVTLRSFIPREAPVEDRHHGAHLTEGINPMVSESQFPLKTVNLLLSITD